MVKEKRGEERKAWQDPESLDNIVGGRNVVEVRCWRWIQGVERDAVGGGMLEMRDVGEE